MASLGVKLILGMFKNRQQSTQSRISVDVCTTCSLTVLLQLVGKSFANCHFHGVTLENPCAS